LLNTNGGNYAHETGSKRNGKRGSLYSAAGDEMHGGPSFLNLKTSNELTVRSMELLPGRVQILGKNGAKNGFGNAPRYLERGKGCHVWDVDGNEYIDLIMGNGSILLGYRYDVIDDAIQEQLRQGMRFSLVHPLELEVAEIIRETVPGAEAVWFGKNEKDVEQAAIRLAFAFTGKSKVFYCSPDNNFKSLEQSLDDTVACVIIEPANLDQAAEDFLFKLRKLCTKKGCLLIFDEKWTGFRIDLGGAQEYFGITADLCCFSNAMANGMPLSALSGPYSIMELVENDDFFYQALSTDALSLAAAEVTLNELRKREVPQHIAHWNRTLRDGYNRIAHELSIPFTRCVGFDHRTQVLFEAPADVASEMKILMQLELFRRGVLWNGIHNLCASHKYKDISHILTAYAEALSVLKCAVDARQVSQLISSTG
jgi:glutamate-1-semialdehyde 2,1-aminomutase